MRRRDRHLHTEFVGLARFALRQALDFRRVQLVPVLLLLRQNPLRAADQVFQRRSALPRDVIELPFDVTHHTAHARAQGTQCLLHPPVLLGMRVAANLARQTRRLAVVVLPQFQAVPGNRLHQMFPAAFEQA